MTQNKKIAVTGGIGSGKSTVCNIIASVGYPVISFDGVYGELLESGILTDNLAEAFGKDILDFSGSKIDRRALAARAFSCPKNTKKLNEITHPAIFKMAFEKAEKLTKHCFFEVPLLFEGNYQNLFDDVIVVLRQRQARLSCVMARNNLTEGEVEKRMQNQIPYETYDFTKYYVIHNDSNLSDLYSSVLKTLAEML